MSCRPKSMVIDMLISHIESARQWDIDCTACSENDEPCTIECCGYGPFHMRDVYLEYIDDDIQTILKHGWDYEIEVTDEVQ